MSPSAGTRPERGARRRQVTSASSAGSTSAGSGGGKGGSGGAGGGPAATTATGGATTTAATSGASKVTVRPPGSRPPAGRPRRLPARWVQRVLPPPDTQGPRVRLGVLWFLVSLPAVVAGPATTAALFALVAGIAALQTCQAWADAGRRGSRPVAFVAAVAMPVATVWWFAAPGAIAVALVPVALVAAAVTRRRHRPPIVVAAATTIRAALPAGLAAAGLVALTRTDRPAAVVFYLLLCAYDTGSFLVGAEASSPSHGIVAGMVCTMVAASPLWVSQVWTVQATVFSSTQAVWVFAGMVAALAPLGQVAAGAASPPGRWVPGLRRLDTLIVAAPLWTFALWGYLGAG